MDSLPELPAAKHVGNRRIVVSFPHKDKERFKNFDIITIPGVVIQIISYFLHECTFYSEKVPLLRELKHCLHVCRLTGLLPRMMRSQIKFAGVILRTGRIEDIHEDRGLKEGNVHY